MNANAIQVGGDHYRAGDFQPWDLIELNSIGFIEGNIIKYITRWRNKGGLQDLQKVQHYIMKLEELAVNNGREPRIVGRGVGPMVLDQYFAANGISDFREKIIISIFASDWTERSFAHALLLLGSLMDSEQNGSPQV